jgi:uncharacterized 2Fe-2S/4Fe-4S cluster protein (DUF4445 family)
MDKEYLIEFYPDGKRIRICKGKSILDASVALGIYLTSVCNGSGTCGKCRVIVEEGDVRSEETGLLTKKERGENYYLACRTYPVSDLKVMIPQESRLGTHQILEHAHGIEKEPLAGKEVGIAVDLGTTTVVAYLVDLSNNKIVDSASAYNKQMIHGEDILTRINYAERHGVEKLNKLIVETVDGLIEKLTKDRNGIGIGEISVAGNTTMTYMLLNKNPGIIKKNLDLEEFKTAYLVDPKKLGIGCGGKLYSLPGIASYVGGDIVADIISSGMYKSEDVSMLIDVGTNGEIVMGNRDWLVACATSAGPAFEGGEVGCGMRATTGAIEEIKIRENHDVEYATIHNDKPRGICGSGFIDLIADLFLNRIIDHNGKFSVATDRIRDGEYGSEFVVVYGGETATGKDIVITEKDIEGIMLSKAAIYAGASTLTKIGVSFENLERIYVAGGFGYYLDVEKAIVIGLLPDLPGKRFEFIGTGSAKGAYMALIDGGVRGKAEEIARKTTYYDLSTVKDFSEEYMAALYLPHRDEKLFPSVEKRFR